jgi:hypothetical protein
MKLAFNDILIVALAFSFALPLRSLRSGASAWRTAGLLVSGLTDGLQVCL